MIDGTKSLEEQYPSIPPAYEIALKSYDWCLHRSDAIDGTIDRLLAWMSSISVGVVAIVFSAKHPQNIYCSWQLFFAIEMFVAIIAIAAYTKVKGYLSLISPKELHKNYLHNDIPQFKSDIIYWAGNAFEANQLLINWKGKMSSLMITFFLLEIISLAFWVFSL